MINYKELITDFPEEKIQYKIYQGANPAYYELDPKDAKNVIKNFILSLEIV